MATAKKKKRAKKKTKKKTATKKQFVLFVLDESGSMANMQQEAVDAFNQQLKDIKESTKGTGIRSKVSLVKFNTAVPEPVYWCVPLNKTKPIKLGEDYAPNGLTAMLDAVGFGIAKLEKEKDYNDKTPVLVIVISDGYENNSKEHTYNSVANTIKRLSENASWTFTYAGANQDLSVVSQQLNIPVGNMQTFAASAAGMSGATRSRTKSTKQYFLGLNDSLAIKGLDVQYRASNFYDDSSSDDSTKGAKTTTAKRKDKK